MNDLRAFGAANSLNARSRTPLKREVVSRAAAVYAERFADPDGRLHATFDILWLSGWAPHESQQKLLKLWFGDDAPRRRVEGRAAGTPTDLPQRARRRTKAASFSQPFVTLW